MRIALYISNMFKSSISSQETHDFTKQRRLLARALFLKHKSNIRYNKNGLQFS